MSAIKNKSTRAKLKRYAKKAQKARNIPFWLSWTIVAEAYLAGVPLSLAFALVEQESGFRNVFGHDPTSSIPRGWMGTVVTKAKYAVYKRNRKAGHGMQGVGPCQLTWYATQDLADAQGGCWKPNINIRVGLRTLKQNIRQYGYSTGIARYNGSGSAATLYSRQVRGRAKQWHRTLTK